MAHPAASAEFRFYEELNDFLPPERRRVSFAYSVAGTRSVKDALEAIGVPHTEVDLSRVTHGYYVRQTAPAEQLREVVRALQLQPNLHPFTRCRECNAELREAAKAEVSPRLPEKVRGAYDRFQLCPGCGRIYWEGTHYLRLRRLLEPAAQPDPGCA